MQKANLYINHPRDYLLIILITFIYGVNIHYLISIDSIPPQWDEAVHLRDSFVFHNILNDPTQLNLTVIKDIINKSDQYPLIRPSGYYPPLAPLAASLLYFIFGISSKVAVMSNLIFLLILTISLYKIGYLIFGSRIIGLTASVLILLFPIVLQHSVIFYLDLPLTAITGLTVYLLLRSEYFRFKKFSIIAGICFGLGMLTKWTFIFFIISPLIYFIVMAISLVHLDKKSNIPIHSSTPFKNVILFVCSSIVTFGFYYFPIIVPLLKETFKYSHGPLAHGPDFVFSFSSIIYYPAALWNDMITPFGFILFMVGIVFLFLSKLENKAFIFFWLVVPYLIFTFIIQTKTPRFMLPGLVPISLIISYCIYKIASNKIIVGKFRLWKYSYILILLVFGILFINENFKLQRSLLKSSKDNWRISDMISVIKQDLIRNKMADQSNSSPVYLGIIPDHFYINGQTFRYYAALIKLPINVIKVQNYTGNADEYFIQQFDRYDYIITKNTSNIVISSFQKSIDKMNSYFYSRITDFKCLKIFPEPDSSIVSIFKRNR